MSLQNGCDLKCLNLNKNRIGTKGVQLLCEALRDNGKLESLFLNDNLIDTDGAYALSKLLVSSCLKELHIAENKIASCGLSVVMDTLAKHNKKLKFLDLSHNLIDIGVLRALRQMLEKNTTLNYLSISGLHKFNQRAI
jgi:Ran GTPase-activating protein (RanGAP) involved in mRNA processing and transport